MASKQERLRQKAAAKNRAKAKARKRAAKGKRSQPADALTAKPKDAQSWNVGPAYVSDNWPEQGGTVHAFFTRQHSSGVVGYSYFVVDLAERGVTHAEVHTGVHPDQAQARVGQVSEDLDVTMLVVDPEMAVKLVRKAQEHATTQGHEPIEGYDEAAALFGNIKPASHQPDIPVGKPVPKVKKKGFLKTLRSKLPI